MKLLCKMKLWDELQKEADARRCSVKKVFLNISQNSQENTFGGFSFLKKRLQHKYFPVNFVKFFKNTFFKEPLWRLLLYKRFIFCRFFVTKKVLNKSFFNFLVN